MRSRSRVRGAIATEYIITLSVCCLIAVVLVTRGRAMVFDYTSARNLMLLPAQ